MERGELETTITYDMEDKVARIFSAIRRDQNKLARAGFKPSYGTAIRGYGYKVPMSRLKWRITSGVPSRRGFGKVPPKPLHTTDVIPGRRGTHG